MEGKESLQLEQMGYRQELKREMGLRDLLFYGLGMMVPIAPVAIFGIVTVASLGHMALAYLLAIIPMSFAAYSYGQMAGAYPLAGAAYAYTQRVFNPHLGSLAGWSMLLSYVVMTAFNYVIMATFLQPMFPGLNYWTIVLVSILIVTVVNLVGIKNLSRINTILVIFMFIAVGYFVIAAASSLSQGVGLGAFTMKPFYNPETFQFSALMAGTAIACFSFLGFDAMATMAEEVKEPAKNISRGTILVCFGAGFLFILQAYFAQSIFPDFNNFPDVDAAFYYVALRAGSNVLATFLNMALVVGTLANAIDAQAGVSRILYGMGRDEVLPSRIFAYVNPKTGVPTYNILMIAGTSVVLAALSLEIVTSLINFGALIGFMLVNLCVIKHYYFDQQKRGPKGLWAYLLVPLFGFLACFALFISLSTEVLIGGGLWLLLGVIYLAITTDFFRKKPPVMS